QLLNDDKREIDMEAAASDGEHLYIVGSHSLHRKRLNADDYESNRERQTQVEPHDDSYRLYEIELDRDGKFVSKDRISLLELLKDDDVLRPFCKIPSKENGIDIEGLAVKDGKLFIGFRGPVLRENFVPVMVLSFDRPAKYELRFVPLEGRGIRDMTAVEGGFLILGGPVGDGDGLYRLYLWDGRDCIPGSGSPHGKVTPIGNLPEDLGGKPEGLALLPSDGTHWRLVLVCDGSDRATEFEVVKP